MRTAAFKKIVWDYYKEHGRHELPWRLNLDPYAILVSEVMLQQTQVERVIPKFSAWLKAFPDWAALAAAPLPKVLQHWQGLGYNRRALSLQRCAQVVSQEYGGKLPRDEASLLALPGIGPYTAAAIRAFVFNEPVIMLETNIRGVFIHHYFADQKDITDAQLLPLVEKTLPSKKSLPAARLPDGQGRQAREWYWALMDYGSYLKRTLGNPARRSRHYVRQSAFHGSNRQVRGAILRALTQNAKLTPRDLQRRLQEEGIARGRVQPALDQLLSEGFITFSKSNQVVIAVK